MSAVDSHYIVHLPLRFVELLFNQHPLIGGLFESHTSNVYWLTFQNPFQSVRCSRHVRVLTRKSLSHCTILVWGTNRYWHPWKFLVSKPDIRKCEILIAGLWIFDHFLWTHVELLLVRLCDELLQIHLSLKLIYELAWGESMKAIRGLFRRAFSFHIIKWHALNWWSCLWGQRCNVKLWHLPAIWSWLCGPFIDQLLWSLLSGDHSLFVYEWQSLLFGTHVRPLPQS